VKLQSSCFRQRHVVQFVGNLTGRHQEFSSKGVCFIFCVPLGWQMVHDHMANFVGQSQTLTISRYLLMNEKDWRHFWSIERQLADTVYTNPAERTPNYHAAGTFDRPHHIPNRTHRELPQLPKFPCASLGTAVFIRVETMKGVVTSHSSTLKQSCGLY